MSSLAEWPFPCYVAAMSNNTFPSGFGWSQGKVTPQPHVNIPEGLYEEEHARQGFFGRTSHLYHRHPPTGWLRIEGDLKPRAYLTTELKGEAHGQPQWFLENADVKLGIAKLSGEMGVFARNGDGDEVRFIHQGEGNLETDYGDIAYRKGDYLVIPRGTTYRFCPKGASTGDTHLVIESATEVGLPDRGMLGRHAQFDPMIMRTPTLPSEEKKSGANSQGEFEMHIKRERNWTKVFYPWNPLNAAGWKGDLSPWALNVADIRPVVSPRYHLPPSVHTTFLAKGFVICSFLPRPLESEPGANKVPFYHRNIDFDEVLFYHDGNFFSREGIGAGAVTFHPQGIHHGPHPNAAKNAADKVATEEIAVMVDAYRPLHPTAAAASVENKEYHMSWKQDQKR
jgi:homogentisate 1,2-dioxygenase